ncbi:MAG: FAD binding domain-containing protein [Peptoniphilaceae bacterium]
MFEIKNYIVPDSLDEAYEILHSSKNNIVLGGTTFLNFSSKNYQTAIDLSKLSLNTIEENDNEFIIGAYVTYGDIERSNSLKDFADNILQKSIKYIVGTQFKNSVTVGASVYSKYGFSDFLTALLVLDAEVNLYKMGRIKLDEFLKKETKKDILTHIYIKKEVLKAEFNALRSTKTNLSLINIAISNSDGNYKVAFGARPQRATLASKTSQLLTNNKIDENMINEICENLTKDVYFASNSRASKEFREKLAKNLFKRTICNLEDIDEY